MKNKLIYLLCVLTLIYAVVPRAYAMDFVPVYLEEDTSEFENEEQYVFSPQIMETMGGTDSFVDKTATVQDFDVPCKAAFLIEEQTGRILYEKRAEETMPMASITKIMTMLLVMEALDAGKITLNDTVPVSVHAYSMGGSQIWLEPGEIFTVDEMLKAVAVSSANDAAVALAEFVGGGEESFCRMMNSRAKELGMNNTNFVNACGLDAPDHYSTAKDISIMAKELMKHPEIYNYTTIWTDYLRGGETQLANTNKLLRSYNGITGLKTGTTSGAGVCICATAKRNDLSLIAVVLGSDSSQERFSAAKKLLDFGFANFETKPFPQINDLPKEIAVKLGTQKQAKISCDIPDALLFVKGATTSLTCRTELPQYIDAPMFKGMKIGSMSLYSGQGKIKEYDIVLEEDAEKIDFVKALSILTKNIGQL